MSDVLLNVKLLLDENLSPSVARRLRTEDHVDVIHIQERSLSGDPDYKILAYAYEQDRTLVTANVCDFVTLAKASELHPGMVLILDGELLREEQLTAIRTAISAIRAEVANGRDMVNRVLRISCSGVVGIEDLPK